MKHVSTFTAKLGIVTFVGCAGENAGVCAISLGL